MIQTTQIVESMMKIAPSYLLENQRTAPDVQTSVRNYAEALARIAESRNVADMAMPDNATPAAYARHVLYEAREKKE